MFAEATDVLLGIDDTDVLGHKPGTGRLARELGAHLETMGLARLLGVVRQQLLVDPRIPYTSHNSPACVVLSVEGFGDGRADRLLRAAAAWISERAAIGSDPGVCLAERSRVAGEVVRFGRRASNEVVSKDEAARLARKCALPLEELGGTGDGIIGALAAVGLTADGNAGRFLELAGGLRDLGERLPARLLLGRGITLVSISRDAEPVPPEAEIATEDRVRPRLIHGRPVLLVERAGDGWRCFDRKKPGGHGEDGEGR